MARRTVVVLTDDIEGTPIEEGGQTVSFAVDGVAYEIDLHEKNAEKMRDALRFYVDHARRVGGRRSSTARASSADIDPQAVRAWARARGIAVNPRGRVSTSVVAQFREAGN